MHSLSGIIAMNDRAVARAERGAAETETSRHCSYSGNQNDGVVLHSAKHRSTVFLKPSAAAAFLVLWLGTNSTEKHDRLVESYF